MDFAKMDGFTLDALKERIGNDMDLAAQIAVAFLQVRGDLGARMRSALAEGDAARISDTAHELKGMAATIGAERLALAAKEIEMAARAADPGVYADPARQRFVEEEWTRVADTLAAVVPSK